VTKHRPYRPLLIGLLLIAVIGAFVCWRFELASGITGFLPSDSRLQARLSRKLADGPLSRTMIITIGAPKIEQAVEASVALHKAIEADQSLRKQLAVIEGGPAPGADQAIWKLYWPRRFGFFASNVEAAKRALSEAALHKAARELKARLAQPISTALSRSAPADPLMILPRFFEKLASSRAEDPEASQWAIHYPGRAPRGAIRGDARLGIQRRCSGGRARVADARLCGAEKRVSQILGTANDRVQRHQPFCG
jgi:predicted exporter